MENKPHIPRNIRRSIENINKNMTPEMRKQLAEEAKKADEARMKEHEYHTETESFISAHGQFLTSIINGWASAGIALNYDKAYFYAEAMALKYAESIKEYRNKRENDMPNYKEQTNV